MTPRRSPPILCTLERCTAVLTAYLPKLGASVGPASVSGLRLENGQFSACEAVLVREEVRLRTIAESQPENCGFPGWAGANAHSRVPAGGAVQEQLPVVAAASPLCFHSRFCTAILAFSARSSHPPGPLCRLEEEPLSV